VTPSDHGPRPGGCTCSMASARLSAHLRIRVSADIGSGLRLRWRARLDSLVELRVLKGPILCFPPRRHKPILDLGYA
jgi:hypothetical protein